MLFFGFNLMGLLVKKHKKTGLNLNQNKRKSFIITSNKVLNFRYNKSVSDGIFLGGL